MPARTRAYRRIQEMAGDFGHVAPPMGGIMVPHVVPVSLDLEATRDEPAS